MSKQKKVVARIKLLVLAGLASAAPPIGPALGQKGVNIMEFCKRFNAETANIGSGMPVRVIISVFENRSFDFTWCYPSVSYFLKKYAGLEKGSSASKKSNDIGVVTKAQCLDIALKKRDEMNSDDANCILNMILGTANSMGIKVTE